MTRLDVCMFGPLQVTVDGETATGFASDKVRALLAYLAVEAERPHRRERLAGLLWPDQPERYARANLRRALSNLRLVIGDRARSPPTLLVTRQTIQFNPESVAWVDVTAFTELLKEQMGESANEQIGEWAGAGIGELEEAFALYRGSFLEGFSLAGCPAFEEWMLFEGEQLHRLALEALHRLVEGYEGRGELERALAHAWRQLELDPWWEGAHQQVMRLLARDGRRGEALAQYETCRQRLAEELGVEPGEETTHLYEQIRDGGLEIPETMRAVTRGAELSPKLPPFLEDGTDQERYQPPLFVARDRELAWLNRLLGKAVGGEGQVVFVTGGPGQGKTALLGEFARRAMDADPDLLVASGNCNAYSGIGDPYLPFRDVMGLLTADVGAHWASGVISGKLVQRLWASLPQVAQALLDHGPHVVPALVSGAGLLSRAEMAAPTGAPWLQQLRQTIQDRRASSADLEQSHFFQQVTNLWRALANRHPLLLVLDDLQWADTSSIALLFHLGRRLAGSRILIACAYRPGEIVLGREGDRHPLEKPLSEFKRTFGDVWMDLDQIERAERRRFVDRLLDTEPNLLGEQFRTMLFQYTRGHPLFTIELLRSMQERGSLVQNEQGQWVEGTELIWTALPARVEAVIEDLLGRLPEESREILSVASVEGEEFTAQVVARVQQIGERRLLQDLHQKLEKRHRLVRERGEMQVGHRHLSRYRFAHALFQQHLYNTLGAGERRFLHREVAAALEEIYEGRTEEIAVQLVRHYRGDVQREQHYAKLAGNRAAAQYANAEALRFLSRALDLTPVGEIAERCALLLAREKVYDLLGEREAQEQDLATLKHLVDGLDDDRWRAEVTLRQTKYAGKVSNFTAAIAAAQETVCLAQRAGDPTIQAAAYLEWGRILLAQLDPEAAQEQFKKALGLAQAADSRTIEAESMRMLGGVCWRRHDFVDAEAWAEQALQIYRETDDRRGERAALHSLGLAYRSQYDHTLARTHYEQALGLSRELGDRGAESDVLQVLGDLFRFQGDFADASTCLEQALVITREIGDRYGEGDHLDSLGWVSADQGDFARAKHCYEQERRIFREIGVPMGECWGLFGLGRVSRDRGEYARARCYFEEGLQIAREIGHRCWPKIFLLLGLGWVARDQGDYAGAKALTEQALRLVRDIGPRWIEGWVLSALGLICHCLDDDGAAEDCCREAVLIAGETHTRPVKALALTHLGHALLSMGHLTDAVDAYQEALRIRQACDQPHLVMEPTSGLARAAMAQGDLVQARDCVEEILSHVERGSLDGTDEPFRIYLTCYQVLRANKDSRAAEVLGMIYQSLTEQAAKMDGEESRRSFLRNVSAHRKVLRAFEGAPQG